jgi:Ribonuclease G/E
LYSELLRDQFTEEFTAIRIDNEQEFCYRSRFRQSVPAGARESGQAAHEGHPIFEEFGLNAETG